MSVGFSSSHFTASNASMIDVGRTTTSSYSSACMSLRSGHMSSGASSTSLYEVLGIPMGANNQDIKAAYRRLARTCHPDMKAVRDSSSSTEFIELYAAYSTLSDPHKRADYDRSLYMQFPSIRAHSGKSTTPSRFSGYTFKNWETDQCW